MNKKLNILFLNSWYPSRVLPTNGDFIQRHAEAVSLLHNVTAIHVITDPNCRKSIEVDNSEINGVRTIIAYIKFTRNPIIKFFRFYRSYLRLLNQVKKIDLVHLNRIYPVGFVALYLKLFHNKKFIISEHWHGYHLPYCQKISFGERLISKLVAKNASQICPVTNNLGLAMQKFGLRNSYYTVPNVVDTDLFKPLNKTETTYNIVHISSMDKVKNIPEILEVISILQNRNVDFKFYLIGNNAEDFKTLSNNLRISANKIYFRNQIPQKKLANYLQQSDLLVLFSSIENSPCVILEAFACGIPVISSNVGGISENFPKNFGTLVPKNNKSALLDAIFKHYNNSNRLTSQEEMHNYIIDNFSKLTVAKKFSEIYVAILQSKNE